MSLDIGTLVGYVNVDTTQGDNALSKFGSSLSSKAGKWGGILTAGGLGAAAAFSTALASGINMEPGRDRIAASLGLTGEDAARAGKVSATLYSQAWGESADEVNMAVEAVMSSIKGMRTASEDDLHGVTEAALTFATTMGVDVTRASQVAGTMISSGLAKNGVEAFDLLTAASQKVPAALREDVMDATEEYGQFFNSIGIKGPEAMAILAKGAEKGMYGIDKAGDAVKEFTIRATDMSAASVLAYESMGMDAKKMANDLLAGGDTANKATNKIIDGLLSIKDPATQANTAIALFGTPLEDLNTSEVPKFLKTLKSGAKGLGDFEGATARAGTTLNGNAATNITQFGRTIKTKIVDTIGGKVLPIINDLTADMNTQLGPAFQVVGDAIKDTTKWLKDHQGAAIALAAVIGTLTALTITHSAVLAVGAAGGMAAWLKGTRLISGATKVWAAVQWAMNAAMAANPIVLAVLAIAALIAAIVWVATKTEWGRKMVAAAWEGIQAAAEAVGRFFSETLPAFFAAAWQTIKAGAAVVGKFFTTTVPAFFSKAWNKVKDFTVGGFNAVLGFIKAIPGKVMGALGGLFRAVTWPFRKAFDGALSIAKSIGTFVINLVKNIPNGLMRAGKNFGRAGKFLLQSFIDGMKNAAGVISGIAGNVWNAVKGLLNGAIGKINAALEFSISLPGPDLNVNLPDIPMLATGGRATGATLAMIGEGREPESVLPDSVLRGLLERAHAAGAASAQSVGRDAPLIGQVNQLPGESTDDLAEKLWFKTRTRG